MIPAIEHRCPEVVELCCRFGVQSLEVFGSVADGTFDPARNDIDFLMAFDQSDTSNLLHRFFGRSEALERLFACNSISTSFVNAKAKRRQYKSTASEADKVHG